MSVDSLITIIMALISGIIGAVASITTIKVSAQKDINYIKESINRLSLQIKDIALKQDNQNEKINTFDKRIYKIELMNEKKRIYKRKTI